MTTYNLRITAKVIDDIIERELWHRTQAGSLVYERIAIAKSTRKDGSISVEVVQTELDELRTEARFSGDYNEAYDLGAVSAWSALGRQIKKLVA